MVLFVGGDCRCIQWFMDVDDGRQKESSFPCPFHEILNVLTWKVPRGGGEALLYFQVNEQF
jgi:hypothetical protein